MAESRRRREHRLERVLGTPALFATAYGNVGSSIYYALGLTAVYALGLTPLVFVIAGVIFAATAATYAEGTVRYPEAGGSSSFARHAYSEVVSFGAAWAQLLVYVVTIATSAFFVPHYLSVFWEPLRENPADIVAGAIVIVVLVALNIVGVQEATKLSVTLAVVDFATQVLLVIIGFVLVFSPEVIRSNVHWGVAPTWSEFAIAIPMAMLAYTGVETVSNLAEEARDPARTVPAAYKWVAGAVFAIYFTLPLIALSAMPVKLIDGELTTLLALPPEKGGYANDPILGIVDNLGVGGFTLDALQIYVGILASTILIIATNAGVIGASRITYSMATYRQMPETFRRLHPAVQDAVDLAALLRGARADLRHPAGQHDLRRDAVLVRRDAVLHRRPRLDRPAADASCRRRGDLPRTPEPAGRGVDWPLFAILGGLATGIVVHRHPRPERADAVGRARLDGGRLRRLRGVPADGRARAAREDRQGAAGARARRRARVPQRSSCRSSRARRRARRCTSRHGSRPSGARRSSRCA